MSTITEQELPSLPIDVYEHLREMDPRSHHFGEEFEAANQLAYETGHAALTLEQIFPPEMIEPPRGFKSHEIIARGYEVPVDQVQSSVKSYNPKEVEKNVDLHKLVTDSDMSIQYCDLRPAMTAQVRKSGPQDKKTQEYLDRSFFRDLKSLAEVGHPQKSVHGVKGVGYTKLGDTKVRAYWMPLSGNGTTVVARIADSADSTSAEEDLYRRVFNKEMHA